MAKYVVVIDGAVAETHDVLPRNWKNISGLNTLSSAELKQVGWFSVTKDEMLDFNPTTHRTGDTLYIVRENDVLETQELIERSADEVSTMARIARETNANDLRMLRNQLLALTDWTQLNDVPEETRQLWAPYRQQLRDLMAVYENDYRPDYKAVLPAPPVALPQLVALY